MKALAILLSLFCISLVAASFPESTHVLAEKIVERPFAEVQAAVGKYTGREGKPGIYLFSTNGVAGKQLVFTFCDCMPFITTHIPQGRFVVAKEPMGGTWVRVNIDKLKPEDAPHVTPERLAKAGQSYLDGILAEFEKKKVVSLPPRHLPQTRNTAPIFESISIPPTNLLQAPELYLPRGARP